PFCFEPLAHRHYGTFELPEAGRRPKSCKGRNRSNRLHVWADLKGLPRHHAASFTYSKSPGLLSMPMRGGAIHLPNLPGSMTCFIRLWIKSPSSFDGSQFSFSFSQAASSMIWPSGVALMSLNSPIWRLKATCGSVSL